MDGGAGEGLGASLSEPCDPVRSRAWGLAGTLGGGELKGREGQEHAVQGRAPWGLGPALEAESFQSCPTVRMYAQGEGGEGRGAVGLLRPCPVCLDGWPGRAPGLGMDTHSHSHTLTHTHLNLRPCFHELCDGTGSWHPPNPGFSIWGVGENRCSPDQVRAVIEQRQSPWP